MSSLSRRTLFGTVLGAATLSAISSPASAATPDADLTGGFTAADRPAVFYSPHSDDETISMGVDIANHVISGRNVLVVLMTNDGSQWLIDQLNGVTRDELYNIMHNPEREGYKDGRITREIAKDIRVREFYGATRSLNLFGGRLRAVNAGFPEGITVAQARSVMEQLNAKLPGASHKTMTYTDPAPDHNVCGTALRQLRDEGKIKDARWYVNQNRLSFTQRAGILVYRTNAANADVISAVKMAARSYKAWNPHLGTYAWGHHSAWDQIDTAENNPISYYHG